MTKKDYEKAAKIVRDLHAKYPSGKQNLVVKEVEDCFVNLFRGDNPQFDEVRFRAACQPPTAKKTK